MALMQEIERHIKTLGYNFDEEPKVFPNDRCASLCDVFDACSSEHLFQQQNNFSPITKVEYFALRDGSMSHDELDDSSLLSVLQSSTHPSKDSSHVLNVFFVDIDRNLPGAESASFKGKVSVSVEGAMTLFSASKSWPGVHPAFFPNFLGRGDYWAPHCHRQFSKKNALEAVEYFNQHPRWTIDITGTESGPPLSVHMSHTVSTNCTTYIIACRPDDACIVALKACLNSCKEGLPAEKSSHNASTVLLFREPFEIHTVVAYLSLQLSMRYVLLFQSKMRGPLTIATLPNETKANRERTGERTTIRQALAKNANKILADIEIGINNARSLQSIQKQLHQTRTHDSETRNLHSTPLSSISLENSLEDPLEYLLQSLLKEKMWMSNYRDQSNVTLTLLNILVGQHDAKNNIDIALSNQKLAAAAAKDNRSMNSIAALTMVFLPATFFATLISAPLFQESSDHRLISGPNLWFWGVLTGPTTFCVLITWSLYTFWFYKDNKAVEPSQSDNSAADSRDSQTREGGTIKKETDLSTTLLSGELQDGRKQSGAGTAKEKQRFFSISSDSVAEGSDENGKGKWLDCFRKPPKQQKPLDV